MPQTSSSARLPSGVLLTSSRARKGIVDPVTATIMLDASPQPCGSFRTLDPEKILEPAQALHARVDQRFQTSGLSGAGAELVLITSEAKSLARLLARRDHWVRAFISLRLIFLLRTARADTEQSPPDDDPLVDLATVDPTILVGLRYATPRNITGRALYPAGARCIVRRHVAEGLKIAQAWLRPQGYGLKIWDAYRPPAAQQALFEIVKNRSFVASPVNGHALHTWGAVVDATLVDAKGLEMKMPTDFDDFTAAAAMNYRGKDPVIAHNLDLLHWAMARGGFIGMRTEWWHFIGKHWRACKAVQVDSMLPEKDGKWNAKDAASTAEAQQGGKNPRSGNPQIPPRKR